MRKDFHKVVTERPRVKYIVKNNRSDKRTYDHIDDVPPGGKVSIRRPYRSNSFNFSDHISPLRRFIEKQIGRKWDDVFSEISKQFPSGGVLNDHIRGHVWDFISHNTSMGPNGVVLDHGGKWGGSVRPVSPNEIYVHPETGMVCRMPSDVPSRKKRRLEREARIRNTVVALSKKARLLKIKGCWYYVDLEDIPNTFVTRPALVKYKPYREGAQKVEGGWIVQEKEWQFVHDVVLNINISIMSHADYEKRMEMYGGLKVYATKKRLLGKKELKKYGLKK